MFDRYKEITFKATVSTKDMELENLNVEIIIDNVRYGSVEGKIYGEDNYEKIKSLVEKSHKTPVSYINIEGTDKQGNKIKINKVVFDVLHRDQFEVAEFTSDELKIEKHSE